MRNGHGPALGGTPPQLLLSGGEAGQGEAEGFDRPVGLGPFVELEPFQGERALGRCDEQLTGLRRGASLCRAGDQGLLRTLGAG